MRKTILIAALSVVLLLALPSGVVLVPSLRTTAVETVTEAFLSAERVTIGAIEVGDANDVVVSNTAVQTRRGRFDVGRMAMTPQLWQGLWRGQGPLDYVNQVRVENVAGTLAAFGSDVPVRLVDLTVQDRAARHAVAISADEAGSAVREATPQTDVEEAEEEETTTVLRSRLLVRGEAITIEVELDARKLLTGAPTDFTAQVTADLLSIEAHGTVQDPEAMRVDGSFAVKTGPLDQLTAWILGEAPESLAGLGAFDGEGRFRMAGETVELADLKLDLIESQIRGDITITQGEDVTGIDGRLAIDRLDFNRLMAAMPADSQPAPENPELAAIDVAFLDGLRGLLKITVAEVLAGPAIASDLGVDLTFEPGKLDLAALVTLMGGEIRLSSQVTSQDGAPDIAAALRVAGIGLQEAVNTAAGPDSALELTGALTAEAKLSARGATTVALQDSLAASMTATLDGMALTAGAPILSDGKLALQVASLTAPIELSGGATVFARPLTLAASVLPMQRLLSGSEGQGELMQASLVSGGHRIEARVLHADAGAAPRLQLDVAGQSLNDLMAWLQAAPQTVSQQPGVFGAYSLRAGVESLADRIAISGIAVQVDEVALSGEAAIELAGEVPRITAALSGDRLDLTPYMAAPASGQTAAAPASAGSVPAEDPELGDLAALQTFDAKLELRLGSIVADKLTVGATALTARIEGGAAAADVVVAEVYGGTVSVHAGLRAGAGELPVDAQLTFEGIDPGSALTTMFGVDGFGGVANGEFRLASQGSRLSQLQERLEANGRFYIEDALVPPQFALLSGNPLATKSEAGTQESRVSGVLLYGRESRRADMQWQRGDDTVAEFSLFEKKKKKRETRLKRPDQRDG